MIFYLSIIIYYQFNVSIIIRKLIKIYDNNIKYQQVSFLTMLMEYLETDLSKMHEYGNAKPKKDVR